MNYFAHGRDHLADPYFLCGTCLPDWLSVLDRRLRVRSQHAAAFADDADSRLASHARGVLRHLSDDRWFHGTRAFTELSWTLTVAVRDRLPGDDGFRPSFLGHILVEILLDAVLIEAEPQRLADYYAAFEAVSPPEVEQQASRLLGQPVPFLARLISGFCAERFLYDYLEDAKLLARLNRVMRRVKLSPLPDSFVELLQESRPTIRQRCPELLTPEQGQDRT